MTYERKFHHIIVRDTGGVFTASVPALPGCLSVGKTYTQAEQNIQDAIALYLDGLQKSGDTIPSNDKPIAVHTNSLGNRAQKGNGHESPITLSILTHFMKRFGFSSMKQQNSHILYRNSVGLQVVIPAFRVVLPHDVAHAILRTIGVGELECQRLLLEKNEIKNRNVESLLS